MPIDLPSHLRLIGELQRDLARLCEAGDWNAAGERAGEIQRLLTASLLGGGAVGADDRARLRQLLAGNRALLARAAARRDQLAETGRQLRRNRSAVRAYTENHA